MSGEELSGGEAAVSLEAVIENGGLSSHHYGWAMESLQWIRSATARIAELEADAKRLDWYGEHPFEVRQTTQGWFCAVTVKGMPRFENLREAIDSAMAAEGE